MADHYVALNQAVEGFKYSDFITGAASTAGTNLVELRVQDGTALTKKDVYNILQAFKRFFQNAQQVKAAGLSGFGLTCYVEYVLICEPKAYRSPCCQGARSRK